MSRDKERGWVQEGQGLTVVDFVVMDITERALRRVVGRMSHRVLVLLNAFVVTLFLLFKRAGSGLGVPGTSGEGGYEGGGCKMERASY